MNEIQPSALSLMVKKNIYQEQFLQLVVVVWHFVKLFFRNIISMELSDFKSPCSKDKI